VGLQQAPTSHYRRLQSASDIGALLHPLPSNNTKYHCFRDIAILRHPRQPAIGTAIFRLNHDNGQSG